MFPRRLPLPAWMAVLVCTVALPATATAGVLPDIGIGVPGAPAVSTGDPVTITTTSGRVGGSVNPNGIATTYRFEYGATPLYGSQTPTQNAGAGTAPVPVSAEIGELKPGQVVHYRLVATNAAGQAAGIDRVLIAAPASATNPIANALPQITVIKVPADVTVGEPTRLDVTARDGDDPVNSIAVDFDDGPSHYAASACRVKPASRAFRADRPTGFRVPYTFARPGVHTVEVTLGSSTCRTKRTKRTTTQTIQVTAKPAKTAAQKARAVTMAASCAGADALPTPRNTRSIERATICVLNEQRGSGGLTRLRRNKRLRKAAAIHNAYMRKGKFFAHTGPGEPRLGARLRKARYRGGAGENLGTGVGTPFATPRGMVLGWMGSAVHRANVLERAFHTVGVHVMAQKPTDPTKPGATYTAEFGTTRR